MTPRAAAESIQSYGLPRSRRLKGDVRKVLGLVLADRLAVGFRSSSSSSNSLGPIAVDTSSVHQDEVPIIGPQGVDSAHEDDTWCSARVWLYAVHTFLDPMTCAQSAPLFLTISLLTAGPRTPDRWFDSLPGPYLMWSMNWQGKLSKVDGNDSWIDVFVASYSAVSHRRGLGRRPVGDDPRFAR